MCLAAPKIRRPLQRIEAISDDPHVLSPPILTQPLYACAKALNVTGYVPDATLDVEINAAIVVTAFPGGSPGPVGSQNPAAESAQRRSAGTRAPAPWSGDESVVAFTSGHSPGSTADYPAGLPRPELFPTPAVQVRRPHRVGKSAAGLRRSHYGGWRQRWQVARATNPQRVNIGPAYSTGQHVRAFATLCADNQCNG